MSKMQTVSEPKIVSQQASDRFLKTTNEGELMRRVVTCSMARRFAPKNQLLDELDESTMTQLRVVTTKMRTRW